MNILVGLLILASSAHAGGASAKLPESDWAQIRAEYERHRHSFVPTPSGYMARNLGNNWVAEFDGAGFTLRGQSHTWGLELVALSGVAVAKGTDPSVHKDKLTYRRGRDLEEWFVNGPSGLEHGYIVHKRPSNGLSFRLAVRGDLRASGSGDALQLTRNGVTTLTYSGLKVWDATGKPLPARMAGYGNEIELSVDDTQARYPVTVDPTVQQAYLKASNTGSGHAFGYSVAISGDTVVVGANFEYSSTTGVNSTPNDLAPASGAVYVFTRSGGVWSQQAYLKASNTGALDHFGESVAISGDTVVVGAPREASSTTGVNSTPNDSASQSGAAYVFIRSGGVWSQQAYLKPSNTESNDQFGWSVAISGDTIVVGAFGEDSSTTGVNSTPNNAASGSGAAYVFTRSGGVWSQQAYLKSSNTGINDLFGISVAISGDSIVVGANGEDSSTTGVNSTPTDTAGDSGAAYVFSRSFGVWSQQAYLKASNTGANDQFGVSVAISGDSIVVGANGEDSSTTGVNSAPNDSAPDAGAAYVFTRSAGVWLLEAYLKASNTEGSDSFGRSVAISGDTGVVGAYLEDSSTTGVNSLPIDLDSSADSGAAYIFTRSGGVWSQQAYLKPFNTGCDDEFGTSVAVSGDNIVVGAYLEDSSTTGVNSTPDELATFAGAAYIFQVQPSRIGTFTSGVWALDLNGNFFNEGGSPDRNVFFSLGSSSEIPVTGDWNGDGKTDMAVYLNGTWLIDFNGNGVWDGPVIDRLIYFGGPGYTPYAGDWNGDGKDEIAVHQNGTWLIDFNGNFAWDNTPTDKLIFFGGPGYTPYIGKWGTSTNSSIAVHQNGTWLIDWNGNFTWDGPVIDRLLYFGGPGYTPVVGDWNGDGKTDLAAYLNGTWIVDFNGNYAWDGTITDRLVFFGGAGFTPVSGDWNGDGKDKIGAFSLGTWVLDRNGNYAWDGSLIDVVTTYGTSTSLPVPGRW
jgi:hypothetical protein